MKGIGSRAYELGQNVVQATADDTKKNLQTVKSQIVGSSVKTGATPIQQPKAPDAMGDFGNLLEQNQTQQNTPSDTTQNALQHEKTQEEIQKQQQEDQAALAAARKNLEQIEEEMKEHRKEREQRVEQEEAQEEQQEEQEEFWKKEEEKKQPVRAGNPEQKGNKG